MYPLTPSLCSSPPALAKTPGCESSRCAGRLQASSGGLEAQRPHLQPLRAPPSCRDPPSSRRGCSQGTPAGPVRREAERSASALSALSFPYRLLTSWTEEFSPACCPLSADSRIQPESLRHTSCSSPRVRSSPAEPFAWGAVVLISMTSSPKAQQLCFPLARREGTK